MKKVCEKAFEEPLQATALGKTVKCRVKVEPSKEKAFEIIKGESEGEAVATYKAHFPPLKGEMEELIIHEQGEIFFAKNPGKITFDEDQFVFTYKLKIWRDGGGIKAKPVPKQ